MSLHTILLDEQCLMRNAQREYALADCRDRQGQAAFEYSRLRVQPNSSSSLQSAR